MPVATVAMTIPAGQSLSDAASIANAVALYLITPDDWTPANLTFQLSLDGSNFYDLFSGLMDPAIGGAREVLLGMKDRLSTINPLDADMPKGATSSIKLRSGQRHSPVPQEIDRTFTLVVVT